ncbi:MAG: hypothetical protein ACFWTZ_07205 [Burkholderia sp.]|jgi:hypothetical protein
MKSDLEKLFCLRLAVGMLGERKKWWATSACNSGSIGIFKELFPKTWRLAAFSATSEAAKLVHREALSNRSQHLFRFETDLEQDVRRFALSEDGEKLFDRVTSSCEAAEAVLDELSEKGVHPKTGAVKLGMADKETIFASIGQMAALYRTALKTDERCYPFFSPKED